MSEKSRPKTTLKSTGARARMPNGSESDPSKCPRDFLKKNRKCPFLNPVGPSYGVFFASVFLNIHLYDLLDVLDLIDELHLCHPLVVLEPAD